MSAATSPTPVVVQEQLSGQILSILAMAQEDLAQLRAGRAAPLFGLGLGDATVVSCLEVGEGHLCQVLIDTSTAAPPPFLGELEETLKDRQTSTSEKSYTKSLLEKGAAKIGEKLREEANELAIAIDRETDERVASEAADVVYHLLVGLRLRDISWRAVVHVLAGRFGTSGHEEKAKRPRG